MSKKVADIDTSKLEAQLSSLSKIDVEKLSKEGADKILDRALQLVPVDTGELRDSGRIIEYKGGYAVEFHAGYAVHVEFGTSRMKAQPYLRPAIDENEKAIVAEIGKDVVEEMKKVI